ncbi:ImuA family protein [Methylobacterium planeticum]|uniref:ImuA protein n=1 Tax=Methylobacterium planeticum TaxID=2615211 RepID=A0A6N6MYK7_9HYPH|nr:ImuA protein [Methylobacterium planeticum]KAB1075253.1 ImuA protein [Methylobacterium planeticum]
MERSRDAEPDEDDPRPDRAAALASLRELVASDRTRRDPGAALPLGVPALDDRLPAGGLGLGLPHEVAPEAEGDEPAALGFTLALIARHLGLAGGEALLVIAPGHPTPYGHGLSGLGLDPDRILLFEVGSDDEAYLAIEEALRTRGLRAVAGFLDAGLPLKQGRRLQLVAEASAPLLLVLRPARADLPNGAATRWRIGGAQGARDRFGCLLRPRWRVHLERCRNGRPGTWLLEWDHAAHRFGLPDALADHAPAARAGRS